MAAADGGRNPPEQAAKLTLIIKEFIASEETEKEFSTDLDAGERKIIHDICYELDLVCRSRGPRKSGRFITVYKPDAAQLGQLQAQKQRAKERKAAEGSKEEPAKRQKTAEGCAIGPEFAALPLVAVLPYNHDSKIFEFGLQEGRSLALPVCACILLKGKGADGADAVRPYTPVSDNGMLGKFQLLIKKYETGVVSSFVHGLSIGDSAEFKHIPFNVKIQHPFKSPSGVPLKTLSMLCGGTGIAPMYQALQLMLSDPADSTVVSLLYGNRSPADILLRSELDAMASVHPGRLTITHVVGTSADEPAPEGWTGEVGWIDEEKIQKYCASPAEDTMVFVCGVPGLYTALCGPRGEGSLPDGTTLAKLGYTKEMVSKF